eukprot:gene24112-9687_t
MVAGNFFKFFKPKVKEEPLPPSFKVLSCSSSSPFSLEPSFKTCGALTFTPASDSKQDSAGPRCSNGTGRTEHLSLLLHVLKDDANAGPSTKSSTSGSPIHAQMHSASDLHLNRDPLSNTLPSQPEPPGKPRTSLSSHPVFPRVDVKGCELITLGNDASTVHLAPVLCSPLQGESTGWGKAISEILSLVMGQDEGFERLLLHQSLHAVMAFEHSFPPGISHPCHFVTPTYVINPANGVLLPSLLVELDTSCLPCEVKTTIDLLCNAQGNISLELRASHEPYKGCSPTELEPLVLPTKSGNSEQLTEYCPLSQPPVTPLSTHPCVDSLALHVIPNENTELLEMDGVPSIPNPVPSRLNTEQPYLKISNRDFLPSDTETTLPRDPVICPLSMAKLPHSQGYQGTESGVQYSQSGCLTPALDPTWRQHVSVCSFIQPVDPSISPNPNSDVPVLCHTSGTHAQVADQAESLKSLLLHNSTENTTEHLSCQPLNSEPEPSLSQIPESFSTDQEEMIATTPDSISGGNLRIHKESTTTSLLNALEISYTSDLEFHSSSMHTSSNCSSMRTSSHLSSKRTSSHISSMGTSSHLSSMGTLNHPVPGPALQFVCSDWETSCLAPGAAPELQSAVQSSCNSVPLSFPAKFNPSVDRAMEDQLSHPRQNRPSLDRVTEDQLSSFRQGSYGLNVTPLQAKEFGVLARGCTVLESIPVMATLLDWSGSKVLYQNMESMVYWGDCQGRTQILEVLSKSREVLDSLLIDVRNGQECHLLAHVPMHKPSDPPSSPSAQPSQYPLSGGRLSSGQPSSGRLSSDHSAGSSANTEAHAHVLAGRYSWSQESGALQPLLQLSSDELGNLSGIGAHGECLSPTKYPSSPRSLLSVSLSHKVVNLLDARSSVHNPSGSEQELQQRNSQQIQSSEILLCSQANCCRISSTEPVHSRKPVIRAYSVSRLGSHLPYNNSFPSAVMSSESAVALSQKRQGTARFRGRCSFELEARSAENSTCQVRPFDLISKQQQWIRRRQSNRNLEGPVFWPAAIQKTAGSPTQDMVDEGFQMRPNQGMVDEDSAMRPDSLSNKGTEKHCSGSSTVLDLGPEMLCYDAILLLQTDITERADLEARIAALAEAQTNMLASMFPRHVLEHMVKGQDGETPNLSELARSHKDITIMFLDVVGFTSMSNEVSSQSVMGTSWAVATMCNILKGDSQFYKVDTCGDCYIVAGGLMERSEVDGELVLAGDMDPKEGAQHVMDYIAAVVSALLWGDTMNTASRMESTSRPGLIQLSETTFNLLDPSLKSQFTTMEGVEVKGKGMMKTHVLSMEVLIKDHTASISPSGTAYRKSASSNLSPVMSLRYCQIFLRQARRLGKATTEGSGTRQVIATPSQLVVGMATPSQLVVGMATPSQLVVGMATPSQLVVGMATPSQLVVGMATPSQLVVGMAGMPQEELRVANHKSPWISSIGMVPDYCRQMTADLSEASYYEKSIRGECLGAVYANYFQHARHEGLERLGIDCDAYARANLGLAITDMRLSYKAPLRIPAAIKDVFTTLMQEASSITGEYSEHWMF